MISGKSFADRCKWVFDPRYPDRQTFSHVQAASGDWVFLNGDYIVTFMNYVPSKPTKTFTFIVHNSDYPFDQGALDRLLRYANHIYAINTTVTHPKLTTIPIGFADRQLPFVSSFKRPERVRDIEIYKNFSVHTNREKRSKCFPEMPMVPQKEVPEYYADLCRSKFVLCPEGTGIDTHRVYESLLCGATPVVLRNSLSHLYERLPVCIVDKWTDPFYVPEGKKVSFHVSDYLN
jgi:hypothetical protein